RGAAVRGPRSPRSRGACRPRGSPGYAAFWQPSISKDALAREIDDGITPLERLAVDGSPGWVPRDGALLRECGAPHERDDLVSAPGEPLRQGAADQPCRAAHRDPHSGTTASASISTSIAGSTSRVTATSVHAGRMAPKISPCARPTASQFAMSVT